MAAASDRDAGATEPRLKTPDRFCRAVAAISLFAMMALTFVSVVARYFLNRPIPGDAELQGFLLGLVVFAAIPLVTRAQRHIAVRSFAALLTGRALLAQRIFVLAATALGLGFMGYFVLLQAISLAEDASSTDYLGIPEAPFVYAFAGLMGLAALAALERLVALLRHGSGDRDAGDCDVAGEIASTE
jgi:TRAP-type C4-dicarboxylate transport system permease small subunit